MQKKARLVYDNELLLSRQFYIDKYKKNYYYYYCSYKNHLDRNVIICDHKLLICSQHVDFLMLLSWLQGCHLHHNNISSLSVFVLNMDSRIVLNFSQLLLMYTFIWRWGLLLPHSVQKVFDLHWLVRWGWFSHSFSNKMTSLLLSLLSVAILIWIWAFPFLKCVKSTVDEKFW